MVSRWCLAGVSVVSRWCLAGVVSGWRLRWCFGGVSVGLGGALVVSQWCRWSLADFFGRTLVVCQRCLVGDSVMSDSVCGALWCLRDVLEVSGWQSRLEISLAIWVSRWCLYGVLVVSP